MKHFIILLLLIPNFVLSQELIDTDINQKLQHFLAKEKEMGNAIFLPTAKIMTVASWNQPIIFQREQNTIPNLLVFYTTFKKDSTLAEIQYDWDTSNFQTVTQSNKPKEFIYAMCLKYENLVKEITERHGIGKQEGYYTPDDLKKEFVNIIQSNSWKVNDSISIKSSLKLIDLPLNVAAKKPFYKINVYLSKRRSWLLNKNELLELDSNFKEFYKKVKNNELENVSYYITQRLNGRINQSDWQNLSKQFNQSEDMVFINQIEKLATYSEDYVFLNYKYQGGRKGIEKFSLEVGFDKNKRINSIRSIKNKNIQP